MVQAWLLLRSLVTDADPHVPDDVLRRMGRAGHAGGSPPAGEAKSLNIDVCVVDGHDLSSVRKLRASLAGYGRYNLVDTGPNRFGYCGPYFKHTGSV